MHKDPEEFNRLIKELNETGDSTAIDEHLREKHCRSLSKLEESLKRL